MYQTVNQQTYFKPSSAERQRRAEVDPPAPTITHRASSADMKEPSWIATFPALLRGMGAAAVLFALYTFLFRGWEGNGDLVRYFMLLAHTGLLAVIALASGHYFKEGKGPRLLIKLALVSVPVNFAILSAFFFAATTDTSALHIPQYVTWAVDGMGSAVFACAVSMAVLIPVMIIGFRTLARGMSRSMAILFAVANFALLLPLRDPTLIAFFTVALSIYTVLVTAKTAQQRTEAKTQEGRTALALQFLPIAILLGRNLWLHANSTIVLTALAITIFVVLRHLTQALDKDSGWRAVLDVFSSATALVTGGLMFATLGEFYFDLSLMILISTVATAAMIYEVAHRAAHLDGGYRILSAIVLVVGAWLHLTLVDGTLASLTTLLLGAVIVALSYRVQTVSLFIAGLIIIASGFVQQIISFYYLFDFSYWALMAIIGVTAIVSASVIESKGRDLKASWHNYRQRYAAWNV